MSLFHTCGCVSVHGIVLTLFTLVILNTAFSISTAQLLVDSQCNTYSLPYIHFFTLTYKLQYMRSASIVKDCSYCTMSLFCYMLCATAGTTGGEFI